MWILFALSVVSASPSNSAKGQLNVAGFETLAPATSNELIPVIKGNSRLSESPSFIVRSPAARPEAVDAARRCESLCSELRAKLSGQSTPVAWNPKCEVVLHSERSSYLQAVGRGGAQTVGSSAVRIQAGKVLHRRIDLMATDPDHALDALSHELVHVLFADLFPDSVPPRWAEEGLALLNDPADKQARHRHDLRIALQTGNSIPLSRLFDSANDTAVSQRAIYYGQSLSLADYLTQIDEPERFVQFVQACVESGHERALNTVYGIAGVADLERRWRRHALDSLSRDGAGLVTTVRLAR